MRGNTCQYCMVQTQTRYGAREQSVFQHLMPDNRLHVIDTKTKFCNNTGGKGPNKTEYM